MWDAVSGGLQPQPWHYCTFGLPLSPIFQNLTPTYTQCKGAPICPSTAYYGTQTLYIYADICYMTNPPLRYILFLSARASTGSVTSESKSVTSPVTNAKKNADFRGFIGKEGVIFFSTKIYRDHINMFLSELEYSELVQRLFEKMTFFRVDPLSPHSPTKSESGASISLRLAHMSR